MNDLIAVKKLAEWDRLKTLVLDSVSSPITRRVYNMALNEFMDWYAQAPRPGFSKATVSAWRVSLETPAAAIVIDNHPHVGKSASWPGRRLITGCSTRTARRP